jgi:hypothetical protein
VKDKPYDKSLSMKTAIVGFIVFSILALPGCGAINSISNPGYNSAMAKQARSLVGKNIQTATAIYGEPSAKIPASTAVKNGIPLGGMEYLWTYTRAGSNTVGFLKDGGTVMTGSTVVGQDNNTGQIIYQDNYASTGHYVNSTDGCNMTLIVDSSGTIIKSDVMGTDAMACDEATSRFRASSNPY